MKAGAMQAVARHTIPTYSIGLRVGLWMVLIVSTTGCGLLGSSSQLKQLQAENDRLLNEYRAQRDRLTKLQETNAALEARVGEAEKLLAQNGMANPSARLSQRSRPTPGSPAPGANSIGANSMGAGSLGTGGIPPYTPPNVPSIPGTNPADAAGADGNVKWRPARRQ